VRRDGVPAGFRALAADELAIRYGIDVPFETGMTVSRQMQALDAWESAVSSQRSRFRDGDWYFAGREQTR
jgi:hypothetical protein